MKELKNKINDNKARLILGATTLSAAALGANANAAGGAFDASAVSDVQTTVQSILGVGVAIAIGFVVFKLGKKGVNNL